VSCRQSLVSGDKKSDGRRVNVDVTHGMLRELDERAARLNVSRQL